MTTRTRLAARIAAALLLAVGALIPVGCSRDVTAPPVPANTATAAVQIAGAMGWLAPKVGGQFLLDPATGNQADKSLLTFVGDVVGSCRIAFQDDAGAEVPWDQAARASLVTNGGPLTFRGGSLDLGGQWGLAFDLTAAVDQTSKVAKVEGGGTLVTGGETDPYTISGLAVGSDALPTTGTISVTVGATRCVVTYGQGPTATVAAEGHTWSLDLDSGAMAQTS